MTKPTVKQLSLDHIAIDDKVIHFDDALYVASELIKIWQSDYDSLPFSEGVNMKKQTLFEWKEELQDIINVVRNLLNDGQYNEAFLFIFCDSNKNLYRQLEDTFGDVDYCDPNDNAIDDTKAKLKQLRSWLYTLDTAV